MLFFFLTLSTLHQEPLNHIFNRLDPQSLNQAAAFYELYPTTEEGKKAWARIENLLKTNEKISPLLFVKTLNRFTKEKTYSKEELLLIEKLGAHLPTRKLKGALAQSEKEVLSLEPHEIEIGRALLLSQFDGEKEMMDHVVAYTAQLDLMAIQILSRLSENPTPEEKIAALNYFVFEENRFRYPPQSIYAKDIDLYTFLPSVMDNHLGVCLGVTTLYLALADRIQLPLEIITPPGHILLSYREGEKKINIETTARGIHLPDEKYLGLHHAQIPVSTRKEIIGMTHINKASTYLYRNEFEKAVTSYKKALPYMPEDLLLNELLGLSLLLSGHKEEALSYLKFVKEKPHDVFLNHENVIEDYFAGLVDEEGIAVIFHEVDEKRSSIIEKQKKIEEVIKKWPKFRAGLEQMAISYLQLDRNKEGLHYLLKYDEIDDQNPTIEYYLAALHGMRKDYLGAWNFLKKAEKLMLERGFLPKTLKDLRKELALLCPE